MPRFETISSSSSRLHSTSTAFNCTRNRTVINKPKENMKKENVTFIGKLPNQPLKALDQRGLMLSIRRHILMMICEDFNRFIPKATNKQIEMDIHSAETTAQMLANRAMELIGKNHTRYARFCAPHPPTLRDLAVVLANAAPATIMTFYARDGQKNVKIGENADFICGAMECADRILIDALIEPRETQTS